MKETIRDLMTVDCRSRQSGSDEDAGSTPVVKGEILVGSVIPSEFAGRELVTADHQQGLDDVQRLQARHHMRPRPVVGASDDLIRNVVQSVIGARVRGASQRCRRGHFEVGNMQFLLNVIRGNAHTAHVVARNALT
jgi:CBS-domain-containing membrane protein